MKAAGAAPAAAFRVVQSGLLTTVQDLGRPGRRAAGVSPGGAMDPFAARAANRIAGNPDHLAVLECTLKGPQMVALRELVVAIAGADLGARLGEDDAPTWEAFELHEGDRLWFAGRRQGARAYLAVAGGFEPARWLGSASTDLLVGRGGHEGRRLRVRDELAAGPAPSGAAPGRRLADARRPTYGTGAVLEAIPGPHLSRLDAASARALFEEPFEVAADANRVGYRLQGPCLECEAGEVLSFGVCAGCVQVPPSGSPILLMADHHTSGGYPVAACVARCSLPDAAQLLPGDHLHFRASDPARSQARWRAMLAALDEI